jgi:hypothetical protein
MIHVRRDRPRLGHFLAAQGPRAEVRQKYRWVIAISNGGFGAGSISGSETAIGRLLPVGSSVGLVAGAFVEHQMRLHR